MILSYDNYYCVVDASDLTSMDFSQLEDTSADTVRYSLDGSKFIVEYSGSKPSFLSSATEYTHTEIRNLINDLNEGWKTNEID